MVSFDFITGDDFRASLEGDARELAECMSSRAYKAVHLLAGSIIEAMLADYLVAIDYHHQADGNKDPLRMTLAELVSACVAEEVLNQRTADLSSAVRSYRNLIHPGRAKRLAEMEAVDENSAKIAAALVEVIADDVKRRRSEVYGLTADQLLEKLETDVSSLAIFPQLFNSAHESERERFVLQILPARYLALAAEQPPDVVPLPNLRSAYRTALNAASAEVKTRAAAKVARVVRRDAGFTVYIYESALFLASDLAYMNEDDREVVSSHILAQAADDPHELFPILEDAGDHLVEGQLNELVDIVVRWVIAEPRRRTEGGSFLEALWLKTSRPTDGLIRERLDRWFRRFRTRANRNPELAVWCSQLVDAMADIEDLELDLDEDYDPEADDADPEDDHADYEPTDEEWAMLQDDHEEHAIELEMSGPPDVSPP